MKVSYPTKVQLLPKKTYPVMFTRGRIHKQKTLRYLPPAVRADLIVVTAFCEAKDLLAALKAEHDFVPHHLLVFPDDFRLVRKRYLTAKWLQACGADRFMFLDDDLTLSVLTPDIRYKSTRVDPGPGLFEAAWANMDRLWSKYNGVGISASSRNNYNFIKPETLVRGSYVHLNAKSGGFFGYTTTKFLSSLGFAEDRALLQDIAYVDLLSNIIVLNEWGPICRVYNMAWATEFDVKKESGGMNVYRNKKNNGVAFLLMLLLLPGAFSRKPGSEERFDDMIKINRQAWTPVVDWKEHQLCPTVWLDSVYQELRILGVSDSKGFAGLFHTKKAGEYALYLLRKLRSLAGENTPAIVLDQSTDVKQLRRAMREVMNGQPRPTVLGQNLPTKLRVAARTLMLAISHSTLKNWREVGGGVDLEPELAEAYHAFARNLTESTAKVPLVSEKRSLF